jgi:hypothetical protein
VQALELFDCCCAAMAVLLREWASSRGWAQAPELQWWEVGVKFCTDRCQAGGDMHSQTEGNGVTCAQSAGNGVTCSRSAGNSVTCSHIAGNSMTC